MSYSFDLMFAENQMRSEGAVLKYGMDLVKRIAIENDLSNQQIENNRRTIQSCLRMTGIKWECAEERKEALYSESARVALMTAVHTIFSQRMLYWPQHDYMLAIIGTHIPDALKKNMCSVHFQDSCDQDYPFNTWSDKIDFFLL